MPDETAKQTRIDPGFNRRVRYLVFGRLALVLAITLGGIWWAYSFTSFTFSAAPRNLAVLFFIAIGVSIVYFAMLRASTVVLWQVRVQFVIDAFLITWLVLETGDLISPYITLYIFLISVTGFYLRKADVHLVAAISALCFGALALLTPQSLTYTITGEATPSRAVQVIAFNIAAFLLVGLLAGRLADRRALGERLQKAEAEFADLNVLHERILSSINSGLITTDLQGKIRAFNRAAEGLAGMTAAEAVGRSVFTIFGDELRAPIEFSLRGVQNAEFTPPNFEASLNENGNGSTRTVACSVSPLIGRSGGVNGLIISFQDTTQLREMEESLRRADRLSAVGRMAAGLAHEIRNPLGSISSAVQYLADKGTYTPEKTDLMGVVVRESDRLNNIISDFLAYAQPHNGVPARRLEDVNLGHAMGECLTLLRHDPAVRERHIFAFDPPKKPVIVRADETQIKQVFWNILKNSIHAMPEGGRLSIALEEADADLVRIIFEDDGCGIDRANLENIYEPFHDGASGTGLGLSIVHRIVTEGGGRIAVESEKGAGTRVTIELPKDNAETFDRR